MRTKVAVAAVLGLALSGIAGCATASGTTSIPVAVPPPAPSTTTTSPTTTTTTPPPEPPCAITTGACVSLSAQQAWLFRDGNLVHGPVPTESGGPDQPTPAGTFRVAWKDRVHRSSQYGTDMPNSVFFAAGGIAFHAGSLTSPSHGCVHLSDSDSAIFFDNLAVGDTVQVVG